jgi:hypothetical protein
MTLAEASPPPQPQKQPPAISVADILQWLKEYFIVVSAIAIVLGIALATVFLYGYLKVFDWRLIWIVQYPDILTFALIAVALVGSSGSVCASILQIAFYTGFAKGVPLWGFIFALIGIGALVMVIALISEHGVPSPHYYYIFYGTSAIGDGIVLAFIVGSWIYVRQWPSIVQFAWMMVSALAGAYVLGAWLGYSVLDSSIDNVNVTVKSETITDAKLILIMSHHTILYADQKVLVVPTDEVLKIAKVHKE